MELYCDIRIIPTIENSQFQLLYRIWVKSCKQFRWGGQFYSMTYPNDTLNPLSILMKCCPCYAISDFVKPTRLLLFWLWHLCHAFFLDWAIHPINQLPVCDLFGSHHIKIFPNTGVHRWFSCGAIRLQCLFHFHYPHPLRSQIIICQPLKIQSNPRAMCKSAAVLCLSEIKGFSGMFLLLKISILSFFPITLSSLLSLLLHSEVKDVLFFFAKLLNIIFLSHTLH